MTAAHYAGLSRIPLALLACSFLLFSPRHGPMIATGAVILAMISDVLDGALARKFQTVSAFGAIMDVTTDKVFVIPLLFLGAAGSAPLLGMCALITMRELLVMGVRVHAAAQGVVMPARWSGKLKSLVLYPALLLLLLDVPGAPWVLALGTLLAILSGIDYVHQAWPILAPALQPGTPSAGGAAKNDDVYRNHGSPV